MADLTKPSERRFKPVCLRDIELEVRVKAARQEAEHVDQEERLSLLAAALNPSKTTYWVAA